MITVAVCFVSAGTTKGARAGILIKYAMQFKGQLEQDRSNELK